VSDGPGLPDDEGFAGEEARWQDVLLARLHHLTPDAFEEFVMYLLRLYGMELERVGQSGDRGIDGIGFAPINAVMSSRVAVQVKKYDPTSRTISRENVSLFQNDAKKRGAERAIFVTLGRYSKPARDEAVVGTPTVDLIDGDRLAELVLEQQLGVDLEPVVKPRWFDRFD
jgi:restriction system protein